jgi:predicted nucleic acid-binding protein
MKNGLLIADSSPLFSLALIDRLKPLFKKLLKNKRFYARELLNEVLKDNGEEPIK